MLPSEPGQSATVLVALATSGVTPSPTMAGKVSSVPPPAMALTEAAAAAARSARPRGTAVTPPEQSPAGLAATCSHCPSLPAGRSPTTRRSSDGTGHGSTLRQGAGKVEGAGGRGNPQGSGLR